MLTDDLPWPELGNVSRGATRGNQGQKGVLGQPDNEGRAVLQLRVQPGVLAVRLNRQASDWYRILDSEVNRALKLTKTYWRKARRRQDYDARADQDHMELHEWLQQLKDKVMSHLELLMQKGDIVGPPYVMPDDADLPFLAKFIERHNAGIAHNPRLRNAPQEQRTIHGDEGIGSVSPDVPELGDVGDPSLRDAVPDPNNANFFPPEMPNGTRRPRNSSISYSAQNRESLLQTAHAAMQKLREARNTLNRAQKDSQDMFRQYSAFLEAERQARHEVAIAEKHRDDTMAVLLSHSQSSADMSSRQSSASLEEHQTPPTNHHEAIHRQHRHPVEAMRSTADNGNGAHGWPEPDPPAMYMDASPEFQLANHAHAQAFQDHQLAASRKHSREWEHAEQLQILSPVFAPRKRMHPMAETFDGMGVHIQTQDMSLPS
ncbi:hypothetical protein PLICRDRAFT_696725 [Plicaturopsis crispa FD-325 SS-3]|nr:hypothetical protein PLICRDRAFT_696725 [Plicaturopsis crispa FD-325 SS-3]